MVKQEEKKQEQNSNRCEMSEWGKPRVKLYKQLEKETEKINQEG